MRLRCAGGGEDRHQPPGEQPRGHHQRPEPPAGIALDHGQSLQRLPRTEMGRQKDDETVGEVRPPRLGRHRHRDQHEHEQPGRKRPEVDQPERVAVRGKRRDRGDDHRDQSKSACHERRSIIARRRHAHRHVLAGKPRTAAGLHQRAGQRFAGKPDALCHRTHQRLPRSSPPRPRCGIGAAREALRAPGSHRALLHRLPRVGPEGAAPAARWRNRPPPLRRRIRLSQAKSPPTKPTIRSRSNGKQRK